MVPGTLWPMCIDEVVGARKALANSKPDLDVAMLQKNLVPRVQNILALTGSCLPKP